MTLGKRLKRQFLDDAQSICPKDVTLMHVRQGNAKGVGHAVLCAKPLIGDAPFVVVLPDVILDEYTADQSRENLAVMLARYERIQASQIMVESVPMHDVSKYGVVDCNDAALTGGEFHPMTAMVEKPAMEEVPSNLTVVGRYVLSPISGISSR